MPEAPDSAPLEQPELMTAPEAAEYLRIPLPTIYYLAQRWQLPAAVKIGGRWRLKRHLLDKQLDVVTLSTDSWADGVIGTDHLNKYGGLFMRPWKEQDEKTDIFVTTSWETDANALGLQEDFSGSVVHILANVNVWMPPWHFPTTATELAKTLRDIANAIRDARKT